MKTREELTNEYVAKQKEINRLKSESSDLLKEIAATFEHKVGEIVKWTERGRRKRTGGSMWNPRYEDLPDKEHEAVLTAVRPSIWIWKDDEPSFHWNLEFKAIKKDGGVSQNCTRPNSDYVWTGEIHKEYLNKE